MYGAFEGAFDWALDVGFLLKWALKMSVREGRKASLV